MTDAETLAALERYWAHSPRALAWAKFASGFQLSTRELENARMHQIALEQQGIASRGKK